MQSIIKISLLATLPIVLFCAFSISVTTNSEEATASAGFTEVFAADEVSFPAPLPTCIISANPFSITRGQSATLTWSTSNATAASINSIGSVNIGNGNRSVTPTTNTTYTMTVRNADGVERTCAATVTVTEAPVLRTCTITASATSISYNGSVTVTWRTTGYADVTVNGVAVNPNGSRTYTNLTEDTIFTLVAVDGSNHCTSKVIIDCLPPVAPVCDSFRVSPATITRGQNATLTWTTTNATSVSINQGIGSVDVDGNRVVTPSNTTTYTLTATANGQSVTCPATVTVTPAPLAPVCDSFTATPATIQAGQSATLTWTTTNATSVTINQGIGSVDVDGNRSVTPGVTTTYTLTATGAAGTVTCPVTVTVTPAPLAPVCDSFTATPATIVRGAASTLNWATTRATSVVINQGIGSVNVDDSRSVSPAVTTTYTLTATGPGGTVTCPVTVTVDVPTPLPSCTLSAAPTTINAGGSSVLTWTSQNATTRVINQGIGSVDVSGTRTINPGVTTTYTMTVTNSDGVQRTCAATVTVTPAPLAPVCDSFTSSPTTIVRGATSTLAWNTTRATSVVINQGIGSVNVDDARVVSPLDTTTYTLTATGPGGTVTCPVTVTVTVPDTVPVCNSFTASPTTLPNGGGTTVLTWNTTRATSVVINQGIGSVNVDDSRSVAITNTTNFILTASDADGDQVTCAVRVLVQDPTPDPITCEDNVSFSANPRSIDEGDNSTLTWSTTGLTSVRFEGISSTALSGSQVVSPRSDTTYTLVGTDGTDTIRCPITIDVDEDNGGGGGGSSTPRCELSISDKSISSGERVTLKWNTSNATKVIIKDSHGKTLITTEGVPAADKKDLYDGELTIRPEKDTTYTLTAERGSKDRECTVKVEVDDKIVVTQTRDQLPLVTGISLTQVPYTGFEAGPMLTVIFYALLVLWAMYLAYVLVIRKNGVPVPAFAGTNQPLQGEYITATAQDVNPAVFVNATPSPVFATMAPAASAPVKESVVVGYGSAVATHDESTDIENQAHAAQVLLSSDAMRYFLATTENMNRSEVLASIITHAKASYPSEDGWVVLNEERLTRSCAECIAAAATPSNATPFIPATLPIGNSSLAEAIVTGNIVAAYQMIGNRPMIALTDAAADLDALYRVTQGVAAPVSEMLAAVGKDIEPTKLHNAINALTGALDGTYTSEAEAVKMAIMKATKAINS